MRRRALLAALMLVGCGKPEPLPPSGVQGPIILHQWRDDGQPPLVVVARRLVQTDAGFAHLDLDTVLVRMPFAQGTLFIAAPRATYTGEKDRMQVRLHGAGGTRLKVSGELGGEPLIGTAEEAWFDESDGAFRLRGLDLDVAGQRQTADEMKVMKDQLYQFPAGQRGATPSPAVLAVLAALPRPLAFPEFRRGDFSE